VRIKKQILLNGTYIETGTSKTPRQKKITTGEDKTPINPIQAPTNRTHILEPSKNTNWISLAIKSGLKGELLNCVSFLAFQTSQVNLHYHFLDKTGKIVWHLRQIPVVDKRDVGFINNMLAFLSTTRFGPTRLASFCNSAIKRAGVGVVPGWVTSWKSSSCRQKQSRELVGQNRQYCVVVGGVLQVVSKSLLCRSRYGANLIEDDKSLSGGVCNTLGKSHIDLHYHFLDKTGKIV